MNITSTDNLSFRTYASRKMKLLAYAIRFAEPAQYFTVQFLARIETEGMDVIAR